MHRIATPFSNRFYSPLMKLKKVYRNWYGSSRLKKFKLRLKRQALFELTVKAYVPRSSHTRLPRLCKTLWGDRHNCFEVFLELYDVLVAFL